MRRTKKTKGFRMQEHSKSCRDVRHDEHAREVSGMFGRIARWYDFLNHLLSGGMDYYWRQQLVRQIIPGPTGRVLDLAAGTMDVSLEILRQHPGVTVPALDYCLPMLSTGKSKLTKGRNGFIMPVQADGRSLPLPDESVDCATIAFGIRNIVPRSDALRELHRVLVPGGRLCILEFGTGKTPVWKGFYNFYLNRLLPVVGKVFSGDAGAYKYLADTIMAFPTADELVQEMMDAGFHRAFYKPMTSGIVYLHVAEKKG
jgi:demethylmenaquinone methyltransferase/2-methoxy-6-polyprenyl-1,4-benzoquinol methylase